MRRLLAAGLAEFGERGFQAVTVDDIVSRANASHGTFYLYFANKDDLLGVLAQEALHAMESIAGEFPVVTRNAVGRAALREWVSSFCDTYEAHAAVIRILSHSDLVGPDAWQNGLKQMWRLAAVVSLVVPLAAAVGDAAAVHACEAVAYPAQRAIAGLRTWPADEARRIESQICQSISIAAEVPCSQ